MSDDSHAAVAERPLRSWPHAIAPAYAPAVRRVDHAELDLRDALLRFVDGRLRDRMEGEDIVQETYVRFYHYRRSRPVANIASFCFTVARNLINDHLRRLRVQRAMAELDETIACPLPRAEEILDYRQRVEILILALRVMPPLRREVFLRRRLDGLPAAVIAADLELSLAAVEKHCSRALGDLRHALERRGLGLEFWRMSRRAVLRSAARWALRDDDDAPRSDMPPASVEIVATLDDPALAEALTQAAELGRLSDEEVRAMRGTRRRALASGVTAMLLLATGLGGWANGWFAADPVTIQHFETQRGQRLQVALADGSRITLNGATSLDVRLEAKQRLVEMRGGQAYFDVAHDADRPFAVRAGESATRVLGTAFDVDMGHGTVRLAVYRGKVRFGRTSAADGVVVPAGWRSRFAGGSASAPTRFDATQRDWRQDWINTDALALGELVEALNRQGGPLIATPPPSLARIALAGRFRLDEPRNLLDAIGDAYGFAVVEESGTLRLVPTTN